MSDINLDFTVSNNSINFTVEPNDITITPTDVNLTMSIAGLAAPNGPQYAVQYNKDQQFTGSSELIWNDITNTLGATNLVVNGNSYLANANITANVSDVHITGGTNGYVLQTDGAGNLNWTAMSGGGGNGAPGGSNTQIQFNDSGLFGGNTGFTFDKVSGNVAVPGNLAASTFNGNGNGLYNIQGLNIVGTVANANYSLYSGNVTIANQPNITNVGNLSSLHVVGTTSIQQAQEKVLVNALGSTGTINVDLLDQAIILKTANATANFTLNFRGNSTTTLDSIMTSNQSMTCTIINTNGATGYYANVISIDGNTVTPSWVFPGAPTSGTVNGKDSYTFNIIKTNSNVFTVLAGKVGLV